MYENDISSDDYSGNNFHSPNKPYSSSENNFYFKVDNTLDQKYSNLSKEFAHQLTVINNELNTLRILIILLIIYIVCYK